MPELVHSAEATAALVHAVATAEVREIRHCLVHVVVVCELRLAGNEVSNRGSHPGYAITVVDAGDLELDVDTISGFVAREHAVHQIPRSTLRRFPSGVVLVETAKTPLHRIVGSADGSAVAGEGGWALHNIRIPRAFALPQVRELDVELFATDPVAVRVAGAHVEARGGVHAARVRSLDARGVHARDPNRALVACSGGHRGIAANVRRVENFVYLLVPVKDGAGLDTAQLLPLLAEILSPLVVTTVRR
mmetsp:Transcript_29917/g.50343  ORF Transcript_29917/g.50343 Transcript_29917/m.50343 type:complete len:248 (-) Transcript_29917:436-1179(-)